MKLFRRGSESEVEYEESPVIEDYLHDIFTGMEVMHNEARGFEGEVVELLSGILEELQGIHECAKKAGIQPPF